MVSRRMRMVMLAAVCFGILIALLAVPILNSKRKAQVVAEADLGDGRIIQIEALSFGENHQVGYESVVLRRFGAWMPEAVRRALEPRVPRSTLTLDEPALVVWVNALDSTFHTNVDCQSIRLDFADDSGTIYTEEQSNWFGGDRFWRGGHVFTAFPRGSKTLKLRVTHWNRTNMVTFNLPNPAYTGPAQWAGKPLPQRKRQGEYEVVLANLTSLTNEATYWKAGAAYWKPAFEIFRNGQKEEQGWDIEWTAEDAYGNRGQELGISQPVLKFMATCYPSATNTAAAILITNLPVAKLQTSTNLWWNTEAMVTTNRVEVLGLFPAGVHTFSDGEYLTNSPVKFGPVRGGAPSGWVGSSRQTPMRMVSYRGHYSDVPIIYVRVADPKSKQRIALRLRDADTGAVFATEPEPQGTAGGIAAFLLKPPATVTNAAAELLLLPPLKAEFYVDTTQIGASE